MAIGDLFKPKKRLAGGRSLLTTRHLKKHGFRSQKARFKAYEKAEKKQQTAKKQQRAKATRADKRIGRKILRRLI